MYRLYGFSTQNTMKVLYVLEELGCNFEFKTVDLSKGEQRKPEFLKINPVGKTPALQHNDFCLFESGAICRYLANVEESSLYPEDKMKRAQVDQWMDYFTSHLGRWLSSLFFEQFIKPGFGLGTPDEAKCKEAEKFARDQFVAVEQCLGESTYLVGEELTIADLFAFAYIEQVQALKFDISAYPNVQTWLNKIEKRESIQKARKLLKT